MELTTTARRVVRRAATEETGAEVILGHTTFIFDLDGTLIDSMPFWIEKMHRILKKDGIPCTDGLIRTITPLGDIGAAEYFIRELGARSSVDEMLVMMDEYARPRYEDEIGLKAGARELLALLKQSGCTLGVLTASPHRLIDPCLKRNGVFDLFDGVFSSEDFHRSKSDPSIYPEVLARLGACIDGAVLVDDNPNAVAAAGKAGLYTIGVFDSSAAPFAEDMRASADIYLDSLDTLAALIRSALL